jgi:hypothetical protein
MYVSQKIARALMLNLNPKIVGKLRNLKILMSGIFLVSL